MVSERTGGSDTHIGGKGGQTRLFLSFLSLFRCGGGLVVWYWCGGVCTDSVVLLINVGSAKYDSLMCCCCCNGFRVLH